MSSSILSAVFRAVGPALAISVMVLASPAAPAHAVTLNAAKDYVETVGARAIDDLRAADDPLCSLGRLMVENMHFGKIVKAALGPRGRGVGKAQLDKLSRLMPALVIRDVGERLAGGRVTGFTVGAARALPNGDVNVKATLGIAGGEPVATGWRVGDTERGLMIIDVELEGYSMVIHYYNRFEKWNNGGGIDGLIQRLRQMVGDTTEACPARRQARAAERGRRGQAYPALADRRSATAD